MANDLSQEQIDQLVKEKETSNENTNDTGAIPVDQEIVDLIGEVGNIAMSQAATTLSSILNRAVNITTPKVSYVPFQAILEDLVTPKVSSIVEFREGLEGSNFLLLDVKDAIIIADLMMGNDGTTKKEEFTELELSAVAEAMNQMIGSASTSLATMLTKKVDIYPPNVILWEDEQAVEYAKISPEEIVCKTSFSLTVEGVIDSEIMQIYTEDMVSEICDIMLADFSKEPAQNTEAPAEVAVEAPKKSEAVKVDDVNRKKINVQRPEFQDLSNKEVTSNVENLELLMDVPLDFTVSLGKTRMSIKEILSLGVGSVVDLRKLTDEPLEIFVNGKLIAQGEVVVINENFGVRITNIVSQKQRLNNIS